MWFLNRLPDTSRASSLLERFVVVSPTRPVRHLRVPLPKLLAPFPVPPLDILKPSSKVPQRRSSGDTWEWKRSCCVWCRQGKSRQFHDTSLCCKRNERGCQDSGKWARTWILAICPSTHPWCCCSLAYCNRLTQSQTRTCETG